ncbi:hypothetical protein [Brucella anthropi]|uniref:hypothetical protein n=1 Tax=Brucella anthropi TaxID=529 RepID=UPI001CFC7BB5|nr:hypothetical protein [Brucella anthropi]
MKSYLPYVIGALLGALVAFLLSALLTLDGALQLVVYGCLPALGGALVERYAQRNSHKT